MNESRLNPRGKPKGARHRASLLAESAFGKRAKDLIEKAIEEALGERGGTTLRSLIPFIVSPLKERPVVFKLPPLEQPSDAKIAIDAVAAALADGSFTEGEARTLTDLINAFISAAKLTDIDQRLKTLEETQCSSKP